MKGQSIVYRIAIISALIVFVIIAYRNSIRPAALVHLAFPEEFEFQGQAVISGKGFVSINLYYGLQVLRFEKKGKLFASVVYVKPASEIYTGIDKVDIVPVKYLEEIR